MARSIAFWGFSTGFAVYEPGPGEPEDLFDKNVQRSALTKWSSPCAVETFEASGKRAPPGDFPASTGFMHFLSPRALDAMGDVFARYGTLYPVCIEDQATGWHLFEPTVMVDCLDVLSSKVIRSAIPPQEIDTVAKPEFVESRLPEGGLFLVPECPHGSIYVCEDIKAMVKKHRLKGFVLQRDIFARPWIS